MSTLCGCWYWPVRWTRRSEQETSRGVTRETRSKMLKIQMPKQSSMPSEGNPSPGAGGANYLGAGSDPSGPIEEAATSKPQPGRDDDGDAGAPAMAAKIRKSRFFGVFRRPAGGADDVFLVPVGESCVICMETFQPNEVLEVLLCRHLYHERCINKWLGSHTSCPMCKADMEEMARNIRKPPGLRRRRSRFATTGTPLQTTSARSESLELDSGYGSDQARSVWSSTSAPAALAGRLPPDSGRPRMAVDGPIVSSTTGFCMPLTSFNNPNIRRRSPSARLYGASGGPVCDCGAVPGARSPALVSRSLNPRSPTLSTWPAAASARAVTPSLNPRSSYSEQPSALRVLAFQRRWSLESGFDGSDELSCSSSTSSYGNVGSIDSSDDEHQGRSRRSLENGLSAHTRSPPFLGSARPFRCPTSPGPQIPSPVANLDRMCPSPSILRSTPTCEQRPSRQARSPSPRPSEKVSAAAAAATAAATAAAITTKRNNSKGAVSPRFPPPSPQRGFPSAVATLSTPQRQRFSSSPTRGSRLLAEDSLSLAPVVRTPPRRVGSASLLRHRPAPASARSSPSRRLQLDSPHRRMTAAASISSCSAPADNNGGEAGQRKSLREGRTNGEVRRGGSEAVGDFATRECVSGAMPAGVVGMGTVEVVAAEAAAAVDERGARIPSVCSGACQSSGGGVIEGRARGKGQSTMETEEQEEEEKRRNKQQEEQGGEARPRCVGVGVSVVTKAPPDDSSPATAVSAETTDDQNPGSYPLNSWLGNCSITPPWDRGSHKTASTEWSEMESQSQLSEASVNSGSSNSSSSNSSAKSACPRRRPPPSPRAYAPSVAEPKRSESLPLTIEASAAEHKSRAEPSESRGDGGGDSTGALTPGALTPGALRTRSMSARMIWD